jgi:hypothetical protein
MNLKAVTARKFQFQEPHCTGDRSFPALRGAFLQDIKTGDGSTGIEPQGGGKAVTGGRQQGR